MPLSSRFEPRCPSIVLLLFYCTHLSHSFPPHQSAAATTSTAARATERVVRPMAARYTYGAASIVRDEHQPALSRHLSVAVNPSSRSGTNSMSSTSDMHIQRFVCFKNTAVSQLFPLSRSLSFHLFLSLSISLALQCEACWAIGGTDGRYGSCLNADGVVATQARLSAEHSRFYPPDFLTDSISNTTDRFCFKAG